MLLGVSGARAEYTDGTEKARDDIGEPCGSYLILNPPFLILLPLGGGKKLLPFSAEADGAAVGIEAFDAGELGDDGV